MKNTLLHRIRDVVMRAVWRVIARLCCAFGFHGEPIGGIEIVEYEPVVCFRYRSFLKCPHCGKEMP